MSDNKLEHARVYCEAMNRANSCLDNVGALNANEMMCVIELLLDGKAPVVLRAMLLSAVQQHNELMRLGAH